ncbi:hypothetical protein SCARR_05693 [Pontiella sulfatireligans]|uniref:Uncharacterized protein n=1 Tax=Pontiella sulfatireligans TaxID=2750658 RepID=A0A6C2UXK0_9BACT|nr:hypothetical protein SCARR_05693 [Pontiella sulfatireligans]
MGSKAFFIKYCCAFQRSEESMELQDATGQQSLSCQ